MLLCFPYKFHFCIHAYKVYRFPLNRGNFLIISSPLQKRKLMFLLIEGVMRRSPILLQEVGEVGEDSPVGMHLLVGTEALEPLRLHHMTLEVGEEVEVEVDHLYLLTLVGLL
jgi:hypothetical protein